MRKQALEEWIRRVAWICLSYVVVVAVAVVVNETRSGAVFLTSGICNLLLFYVTVVRKIGRVKWTILFYFSLVHRTLFAFCVVLVLFVGFLAVELGANTIDAAWMLALGAISAHQAYRGVHFVRKRWRSADDVMSSLRSSASKRAAGLPSAYDFGFFVLISITSAALSRIYGYQVSTLIALALIALVAPFLLGLIGQASHSLRSFFPEDRDLE